MQRNDRSYKDLKQKHKKTLEEKVAVAKQKKQQKRAKRKKEARDNLTKEEILQDDRFFFIPASNEPSSHACMDIWRLPRGSNTPLLAALQI